MAKDTYRTPDTAVTQADALRREFLIRYRLPRPLSRAYEAVCFALEEGDIRQRARWCAKVAIRFLAALRQASSLCEEPGYVSVPTHHDLRRMSAGPLFPKELEGRTPVRLLELAGIYSGGTAEDFRAEIRQALQEIDFLARYRLIIVEKKGLRVLLGPRMEFPMAFEQPEEFLLRFPPGTPLLVDPSAGTFLSLSPLAVWVKEPSFSFGHLYLLRHLAGNYGKYVAEGIPGSPGIIRLMNSAPGTGRLDLEKGTLPALEVPAVRFPDGSCPDGSYDVMGLIWRGGTSDIYIARKRESGETVVLKTFEYEAGVFDENYWHYVNEERFTRDIRHRGVIQPRKVHLECCGTLYEENLAHKGSLGDLIDSNGVLSAGVALDIMVQLLDALEAIHAGGVVHNDIKPDNILFDEDGSLRIIDFGNAERIEERSRRLRPGVPVGTPGYMAPELGSGGFPSVKSDLFSAGVTFVHMLSGYRPPPPGGIRSLREIPAPLYDFLDRCLAHSPADRYASAREAKEDLKHVRVVPDLAITLDVEGTLIDNFYERNARPGLHEFLTFSMENFDRIFIYTTLDEEEVRAVFEDLARDALIPAGFLHEYEYVTWGGGKEGSLKDLRRCRLPLEQNAIVDDSEAVIPEDQAHRWIRVPEYNEVRRFDRGLFMARSAVIRLFDIPGLPIY